MERMGDIFELAKQLNQLYEVMYVETSRQVDYIIQKQISNKKTIEYCLDMILNIPTEKGYLLFEKLCTYYMNIDEYSAKTYFNIYKELYSDEEKSSLKKIKI